MDSIKISSYMKNLMKSAGYISADVFKSYAPVTASMIKNTKETGQDIYQKIADFATNSASDFSAPGMINMGKEIASNTWKNAIEDLKSGKIYNKERQSAMESEIIGAQFGEGAFDLDFNFDLDDEDWGDDSESVDGDTKVQVEADVATSKAIIASMDAVGRGLSASFTETSIQSATYIASSAKENNLALLNLNKEGFGTITKALMSVNENIVNFSKIGEPLTAHMQNSSLFFTKTGESLQNIEQTLKQIETNTNPKPAAGSKGYNMRKTLGSLMSSDEGINLFELKEALMDEIKQNGETLSIVKEFLGPIADSKGKNINGLGLLATEMTKLLIPNLIKESVKGLDESIKYALGAGLTKISTSKGGILGLLGSLLPSRDTKRIVSTGEYEKGPISWDGIARKALIDVIPTTLLQIYSVLSGTDPLRFDYNSGKYVKTSEISKMMKDKKKEYVEESGGDLYKRLQSEIRSSGKSDKDKEKMLSELYKYFEKAFDTTDHHIMTQSHDIDPKTYEFIKQVVKTMENEGGKSSRSINKWVVDSNIQAAQYGDFLRSEENSGFSLLQTMHDELSGEKHAKLGTKTTILGLDEFGHNYYFYLQGIWRYTGYLANNINTIGRYGSKKKAPNLTSKKMPIIPMAEMEQTTINATNAKLGIKGSSSLTSSGTEEEEIAIAEETRKKEAEEAIKKAAEESKSKFAKFFAKLIGKDPDALSPGMILAVGTMDSFANGLDTLLWGGDDPNKGLMTYLFDKAKNVFDDIKNKLFGDDENSLKSRFKNWFKDKVGKKWDKSQWVQGTKDRLKEIKDSALGSVKKVFIGDEDNGTATYGRKVTKTGIVTVSEGELIIPSEYNPFYHGATNKASQIANELRISRGRYPMYAEGTSAALTGGAFVMTDPDTGKTYKSNHVRNKIGENSIFGILLHAADSVFYKAREVTNEIFDEDKIKEDEKKFSDKIGGILGEIGGAKGDIGAGAVIGGVGSALLGVNPIFGAFMGAGLGFLNKSTAFQNFLFGEVGSGEDGKRKHQKAYDFMMKQLPSIGKGAGIGAAAGIFMGSPILGAFLGGATGFMLSNESFQDFLFGEKDEKTGQRKGGVLANKIFANVDNTFHNIGNRVTRWLKDLGSGLKDKVTGLFDKLKEKSKDENSLFGKLFGENSKVSKTITGALQLPFKAVGGITGAIDNRIAKGNLKGGYSTFNKARNRNMTAEERIKARNKFGLKDDDFNNFDKFLASINDREKLDRYKELITDIKVAPNGSPEQQEAINSLLNDPDYKAFIGNKSGKELAKLSKFFKKNSGKLSDLVKDERNRKGLQTAEEIRAEKQLTLIDRIAIFVESIATKRSPQEIAPDKFKTTKGGWIEDNESNETKTRTVDDENTKIEIDAFGNEHQYVKNSQGEWVEDKEDSETKDSRKRINSFFSSITNLPSLIGDKLKGLFGKKDEEDEEKKPSWLSSIFDWAKEKISAAKDFFTTKLSGIGSIGSILASVASIALVTNAIFGDQDNFFNRIINSISEAIFGTGKGSTNSESGNGGPNDKGGTKTQFQDKNGNPVTVSIDDNGNRTYINSNGEVVDTGSVRRVKAGKDTFISSFRKTTVRQIATGQKTLAGAIIKSASKNNIIGTAIDSVESGASRLWSNAVKAGTETTTATIENGVGIISSSVDDAAVKALSTNVDDILMKLATWIDDIPFVGKKLAPKAVDMFADLSETLSKNLGKYAAKASSFLGKAVPVLTVALMVSDFITGWEDTRSTLGITKEPTTAQRALAGLLRLLKNLIPFIGPLIPDSLVVNVLAKYVGPALGVDTSELLRAQDEAKEQVEAYNKEHGTDYDVAEYNKAVLHDYTFTERIGNAAKTTWQQTKDSWSQIKSSYTDAGGGLAGFSEAVKTAFKNGLPGILGEVEDAKKQIRQHAFKGELEEIWSIELSDFGGGGTNEDGIETATPSIFSKMIGQIPLVTTKILMTPVAIVAKVGNWLKDKLSGIINIENIQKVGSNISELLGVENTIQAIADGDLKSLWTYSSADENDNGFIHIIKTIPTIPLKLGATLPALLSKAGHIIWDNVLGPIVDNVKITTSNFGIAFKEGFTNELTGEKVADVTELTDDEGNPLSGFQKAIIGFGRIAGGLGGIFYKAGKVVKDKVVEIFGKVKSSITTIARTSSTIAKTAFTGDPVAMWNAQAVPDDENNPISGFSKAIILAEKVVATPISGLAWVGRKAIAEPIANTINMIKTTIDALKTRSSQLQTYVDSGDLSGLWQDTLETEDNDPIGGFAKAIDIGSKVVMTIPTGVHTVGSVIHSAFSAIKDTIVGISTTYASANSSMINEAKKGSISGIWDVDADYGEGPLAGIMGAVTIGGKIMNTFLAIPYFVGNKIKGVFDPIVKTTKTSISKFSTFYDNIMEYADDSDYSKIHAEKYDDQGGVIDGMFSFASNLLKVSAYISATVNWLGNKLSNVGESIVEGAKDALGNTWVGEKLGFSSNSGSGSGLAVNGSKSTCTTCNKAFQSQLDPRYKDISFGGSTVGEAGCGPAVAAMASASMGGNLDMTTAINKARSYTNNDGTSAKYFEDTLNASPLNNTSTVKSALESGRPVVLLGKDPSNKSKENSPFGPNNHYVLATGMKNGKVLVNDPESNGPKVYDQSILNKSNYNLTFGGSSRRRGRGGFDSSSTDAQQIWAYLTTKQGYTPQGAAGIMGCWAEESSLNPNTIEGFYLPGYPGDEAVRTTSGLNDFTTNVLFPAYSGKNINKSAYKGTDGNYYPGFGLAQWTGPRGQSLHEYSNTSGSDWFTLDNQLSYFSSEMAGLYSGTDSKLKNATDVNQATKDAMNGYEGNTSSDYLSKRKPWANQIYNAFKDSNYVYDGSASSSSSSSSASSDNSSSSSSSSSSGGLLSSLASIFGSLTNIFDISNGFSLNSDYSSSSSSSSSKGNTGNASGAQAAANAASNEIGYAESGNNITKFGAWSGCDGQPWCAAFAAWAIAQAFDGSKDKAVEALYNCSNVNYTPTLTDTFKANNAWYQEPEVGDEVMYGNPGAYHVGLVTSVDKNAGTFQSVEGNSSDQVQLKNHSGYLEGNVIGFGRPDYSGATANVASNGNTATAVNGDSTDFKATGSGLRGGSSGLLRKAAPSRFAYGSMKGQRFRFGGASGLTSANRFSSNSNAMKTSVTNTLSSIKSSLTKSNGNISGIDPSLVAELLSSITSLLNNIANNTAPTERIYNALTEYIDYIKGNKTSSSSSSSNEQVTMPRSNDEIDSNLAGLVSTLAAIAKG